MSLFLISWGEIQDLPVFWAMGEIRWPSQEMKQDQNNPVHSPANSRAKSFPRGGPPLPPTSSRGTNAGLGGRMNTHWWPYTGREKAGMGYCRLQPNVVSSSMLNSSYPISSSIFKFVERL